MRLRASEVLGNALGSVLRVGLVLMPAVLNSPLGELVASRDVVLGEGSDDDIGPLTGLRGGHLEGESSLVGNLEGLLLIVEENFVGILGLNELQLVLSTNTEALRSLVAAIRESAEKVSTIDVPPELLV